MFTEIINTEAQAHNTEAIKQFFRMHGEETASTYSNLILEMMNTIMLQEFNEPKRSNQELEDLVFELKELNRLVTSLKDPAAIIAA